MPILNNVLYGLLNTYTGEAQTFSKVTTWIDGSAMDDSKCDGTIFRKKDAEYFKLNYTGPVNIKWFGAKGDGIADDTPAFQRFIDAFTGVGETALLEHGTFLVKDLVIPTGYRFMSNQKPASNSYAFVNATVKPAPGAQYIFIVPATTRYAVLENLNIDGDYENHPDLLAAISFTGAYSKLLGNNINACAQACVIMPEATTCTIKDNFMGGWFGPAPEFIDENDFRGTLQIEVCGDSYIVDNEFSASLPYFTSYADPSDVLRDKIKGRICAMAVRTYFGNSVCTGNVFENGDRGVVLAGCVYSYFGGNRYELSGMGNLYVRGLMYNTTFLGERFADGSLAGDGVYDDIELATGAVGNVSFISPTFLILSNSAIPASSFKVRYNLTNYASLEISWIEPVYSADYITEGYINPTLPAFPVREIIGQYYPQDPIYKSSLTIGKRLANDGVEVETTGYVKIDAGTTAANQNRTGIVGWYKANDLRVSAIGFDNADNAMSFALTNPGVYSFSNGGLFAAKDGGTYLNLQSNDGSGACAINFYSDPSQDHIGLISLNAETGQFNVVTSGQMLFQSPGFTYIGGDITVAKAGGVSLGLLCSDSTGTSMFKISSDPLATHEFRIAMDNATGVTRLSSGEDIIIGITGGGNFKFQQNGLTFIPQTPTPGSTSNSYILGRNTTTGEITIIDAATIAPAPGGTNYIQNQNLVSQTANQWISGGGRFDTGLIVNRTVADSTTTTTISNLSPGSTGDILRLNNSTGTVWKSTQQGLVSQTPSVTATTTNVQATALDIFPVYSKFGGVSAIQTQQSSDATPGTYTGISPTTITGTGTGLVISATVTASFATMFTVTSAGSGYTTGDVVTIPRSALGGPAGTYNLFILNVSSAGSFTTTTYPLRVANYLQNGGTFGDFTPLQRWEVLNRNGSSPSFAVDFGLYWSNAGSPYHAFRSNGVLAISFNPVGGSVQIPTLTSTTSTIDTVNARVVNSLSVATTNGNISVSGNLAGTGALSISPNTYRSFNSISSNQRVQPGVVASLTITNAGSGYTPGSYNVNATGGTGTGLTMAIIVGSGGTVTTALVVAINSNYSSGYTAGDTVSGTFAGGSGFTATVTLRADTFTSINNTDVVTTNSADTYYAYRGTPTINQTTGGTGNLYGFYWNPILTALLGTNVAWENVTGNVKLCSVSGTISIGAAPTTSAGTYDFLTRNTATGVVEKVPTGSMPFIQNQSSTSQSANFYINGTARISNLQFTPLPADAVAFPSSHYGLTLHSNGTVQKVAGGFLPLTPSLSTPILGPVYMTHSGTLKLQFSGPESMINFYTDAGGYTGMFGASSSGMVLRSMLNKPMSLQGGTISNAGYSPSNITIAADGTLDSNCTSYKFSPYQGIASNAYWIAPNVYRPVSNLARSLYIGGTFYTVANNDVIVGLDIDNTIINAGTHTGVKKIDIRTTGDVKFGGAVAADGGATLSGNVSIANPRMGVANVAAGATMDPLFMLQVFTGASGSTILLPAAALNTDRMLIVKNQTGSSVSVGTTGGGNEIFFTGGAAQATLSTNASGATTFISDGTYWNVISKY